MYTILKQIDSATQRVYAVESFLTGGIFMSDLLS